MKNIYSIVTGLLLSVNLFAQAPEKMSYQSVVRNNTNTLITNQAVGMRISILQGSAVGTAVYVETQTPMSNANGLVSLEIGGGTVVTGSFASIDWSNGLYFIKTETDPTGGTSYTITGASQLLSTPYALYAKTSGSSTPGPQGPQGATGPAGAANASGTLNYISKFTPDGITLGNSLLFDNGNNVGIGTNTPSVKLDVNANAISGFTAKFNSPDKTYLGLYESDVYRGYVGSFYGDAPDVDLGSSAGSVHLVTGGTIDLTAKAGDIGIGTTSPSARLEVTTAATGQVAKLNAADQTFMSFWENNAYRGYVGSYYGNIADVDLGSFAGAVHLVNGTGSDNITLTAKSGKVGIGTQNPDQMLHVNNSNASTYMKVTSGVYQGSGNYNSGIDLVRLSGVRQWRIANSGTDTTVGGLVFQSENTNIDNPSTYFVFDRDEFYPFIDNTVTLGASGKRWSVIYAANGTINTSDARDKTNIQNIKYGLDEIMKLRPVSFNWKENPQSGTKLGLIAQELKEVIGEVVVQGGVDIVKDENENARQDSDRYGVFYSDLIPVLIKATQEQQLMINEMKKQIEELKKQIYVNNNDKKTNTNTVREALASSN